MENFLAKKAAFSKKLSDKYEILGFVSSGTYGKVYKAKILKKKANRPNKVAIKQFKPQFEGERKSRFGISMSACREIAICRELNHVNVVFIKDVLFDDYLVNIVMDYAEYDLSTIIQYHKRNLSPLPELVIKSMLFQTLSGIEYLHSNGIMHRDIKPANLLIHKSGLLKIADLGLARRCDTNFLSLYSGDKVVVTLWYRSPELLLGTRHYTQSIDIWAIGCVFGELLTLRPMFAGEEIKMLPKKPIPFQKFQVLK
ncbi:hypothetical protein BB560_006391, partial [Smittium megazygosporum]